MIKQCTICGAQFTCFPSDKKTTCGSADCTKEQRRQSHVGKRNKWTEDSKRHLSAKGKTDNLLRGTPAAQQSPLAGAFETNQNALIWTLQAPDGTTHIVRNLALWLREHADMLDGTPEQARAGLMQIKRSMEHKTKRPVRQWKGWHLVKWEKPPS